MKHKFSWWWGVVKVPAGEHAERRGLTTEAESMRWPKPPFQGSWPFSFRLPLDHRNVLSRSGEQGAVHDTPPAFCPLSCLVLWDMASWREVSWLSLDPGLDYSFQYCWPLGGFA